MDITFQTRTLFFFTGAFFPLLTLLVVGLNLNFLVWFEHPRGRYSLLKAPTFCLAPAFKFPGRAPFASGGWYQPLFSFFSCPPLGVI